MVTSASTMTTGLRRPQSYGGARPTLITSNTTTTNSNNKTDSTSPLSPVYGTRLAQPNSAMEQQLVNSSSSIPSRISRPRRPSVIGSPSTNPVPNKSTLPQPRPTIRQRTMSDAGRLDMSNLPTRASTLNSGHHRPRADLRRSLYLDQDDSMKSILSDLKSTTATDDNKDDDDDSDDDDDTSKARRYRASAPLLNAYGVPTVKSRASMGALKYSSSSYTSTAPPPPAPILPPSDLNQKIRVCVRKRPLNRKELEKGEKDISPCIGTRTLHINEPK